MDIQHKSQLHVYRELKQEVGVEEYLDTINRAPSRFLKFCSSSYGLFEECGKHADMGASQECLNCGSCKESVEHVLFEC